MPDLVISSVITGTIAEFIDYSLFVVGIMMLYYLVRFVLGEGESAEAAAARRDGFSHWLHDRRQESQERGRHREEAARLQHEAQERHRLFHPVIGFLVRAQNNTEDVTEELRDRTAASLTRARDRLHRVEDNVRSARHRLRAVRVSGRGENRQHANDFLTEADTIAQIVAQNIASHMPHDVGVPDNVWQSQANHVNATLDQVRGLCGDLHNRIQAYIEEGRTAAAHGAAHPPGHGGHHGGSTTSTGRGPPSGPYGHTNTP